MVLLTQVMGGCWAASQHATTKASSDTLTLGACGVQWRACTFATFACNDIMELCDDLRAFRQAGDLETQKNCSQSDNLSTDMLKQLLVANEWGSRVLQCKRGD